MNQNKCGVYSFTHIPTGKKYIGSSLNCQRRYKSHLREIERLRDKAQFFHKEASKLGITNFKYEVIEYCEESERFERELHHIKLNNSFINGFNLMKNPTKSWSYDFSPEVRQKMSEKRKAFIKNNPESASLYSESIKSANASYAANTKDARWKKLRNARKSLTKQNHENNH